MFTYLNIVWFFLTATCNEIPQTLNRPVNTGEPNLPVNTGEPL
jgi:hypothetical protein